MKAIHFMRIRSQLKQTHRGWPYWQKVATSNVAPKNDKMTGQAETSHEKRWKKKYIQQKSKKGIINMTKMKIEWEAAPQTEATDSISFYVSSLYNQVDQISECIFHT